MADQLSWWVKTHINLDEDDEVAQPERVVRGPKVIIIIIFSELWTTALSLYKKLQALLFASLQNITQAVET